MRLEIFDETKETKEEKKLRLRLVESGDDVDLVAVDENGDDVGAGMLLSVLSSGAVRLMCSVNEEIGLQVTKTGHVRVEKQ